jgi:hypothetical protein
MLFGLSVPIVNSPAGIQRIPPGAAAGGAAAGDSFAPEGTIPAAEARTAVRARAARIPIITARLGSNPRLSRAVRAPAALSTLPFGIRASNLDVLYKKKGGAS